MLAIEFGLTTMTEGDVVRINPYLPNTVERISQLKPHVVIIERNGKNNELALEIMSHNVPLIVMDEAQGSITILAGEHAPTAEISELTRVIERINRKQVESKLRKEI